MSEPAHNTPTPEQPPETLEQRLKDHPELRAKFEELLKIVENAEAQIELADHAEQRVLDELSGIGRAALQGWAIRQEQKKAAQLRQVNPSAQRDRKKRLLVHPRGKDRSRGTSFQARLERALHPALFDFSAAQVSRIFNSTTTSDCRFWSGCGLWSDTGEVQGALWNRGAAQ